MCPGVGAPVPRRHPGDGAAREQQDGKAEDQGPEVPVEDGAFGQALEKNEKKRRKYGENDQHGPGVAEAARG